MDFEGFLDCHSSRGRWTVLPTYRHPVRETFKKSTTVTTRGAKLIDAEQLPL